jgi:hypothetical protein
MTELPYSPYLVSEYVSATERITQTMYTADQMRDYGRAEYMRGLEDAAKVCESMPTHISKDCAIWSLWAVRLIRALAGEKT